MGRISIPVITRKYDQGIVSEPVFIKRIQDLPDFRINPFGQAVIIVDIILAYFAVMISPVCACPPPHDCGPCTSGSQLILLTIALILTLYLFITIIYSIYFKLKR